MKKLCECGKMAVWCYIPGGAFACDDCVSRGCSCNEHSTTIYYGDDDAVECEPEGEEGIDYEWIDDNRWRDLDNGKEIPCCEWFYHGNGWDKV